MNCIAQRFLPFTHLFIYPPYYLWKNILYVFFLLDVRDRTQRLKPFQNKKISDRSRDRWNGCIFWWSTSNIATAAYNAYCALDHCIKQASHPSVQYWKIYWLFHLKLTWNWNQLQMKLEPQCHVCTCSGVLCPVAPWQPPHAQLEASAEKLMDEWPWNLKNRLFCAD